MPSNNATFLAPATINITADASDTDGTVTMVEFFQRTTPLGTDTTSPYSFTWTNVAAGNYRLTVRATDTQGARATSSEVGISVTPPNVPKSRYRASRTYDNKNGKGYWMGGPDGEWPSGGLRPWDSRGQSSFEPQSSICQVAQIGNLNPARCVITQRTD